MNTTPQSTRGGLSVWHIFVFAIVAFGTVMIAGALADGLYFLAAITLLVVAWGFLSRPECESSVRP